MEAGTLIFNIGYGPWQSHAWFHALLAEAKRVSAAMSADSPLVRRLWPRRKKGARR